MERSRITLAKNLRELIKRRGYKSEEKFAHEYDIDKGWLSRVLNKKIDPSFSRVVKLAKVLDVGLESLYPGKRRRI